MNGNIDNDNNSGDNDYPFTVKIEKLNDIAENSNLDQSIKGVSINTMYTQAPLSTTLFLNTSRCERVVRAKCIPKIKKNARLLCRIMSVILITAVIAYWLYTTTMGIDENTVRYVLHNTSEIRKSNTVVCLEAPDYLDQIVYNGKILLERDKVNECSCSIMYNQALRILHLKTQSDTDHRTAYVTTLVNAKLEREEIDATAKKIVTSEINTKHFLAKTENITLRHFSEITIVGEYWPTCDVVRKKLTGKQCACVLMCFLLFNGKDITATAT
jgi:hypothetical protein